MKKTIKKNKSIGIFIFLTLLGIILLGSFLINLYHKKIDDFNTQIFLADVDSNNENHDTFSFFSGLTNMDKDTGETNTDIFTVGIRPGEKFEGISGIKNESILEHVYTIEYVKFVKIQESENEEDEDKEETPMEGIRVVIDKNFLLDPYEIKFAKYIIEVDKDVPAGEYEGILSLQAIDSNAKSIMSGNIKFDLAMGIKVKVIVDPSPPVFDYKDLSAQAKNLAFYYVLSRFLYAVAGLLILTTVYICFLAFKKNFNHKKT